MKNLKLEVLIFTICCSAILCSCGAPKINRYDVVSQEEAGTYFRRNGFVVTFYLGKIEGEYFGYTIARNSDAYQSEIVVDEIFGRLQPGRFIYIVNDEETMVVHRGVTSRDSAIDLIEEDCERLVWKGKPWDVF